MSKFGLPEFIFRVIIMQDNLAPCELCGEKAHFTIHNDTEELMAYCMDGSCINNRPRNFREWPLKPKAEALRSQTWEEFFAERCWNE